MPHRWLLGLLALALVAYGWWRLRPPPAAATPSAVPAPAELPAARVPPATKGNPLANTPGGYVGPDPASLSPAERAAMQNAEVERSATATPPTSYRGIDGKPKVFQYPDPAATASAERNRQAIREQLMRELAADPARFAREHHLSLKQVQWIVDGEADFPDELLGP